MSCGICNGFSCSGDCSCVTWKLINDAYLPAVTVCSAGLYVPNGLPTVTTDLLEVLYTSNVHVTGTVTNSGGSSVTDRGFVWSTSINPTISDEKVSAGSGNGYFEAFPGSLPHVLLYFRAFATNGSGTAYGQNLTGTPQFIPCLARGTAVSLANGKYKNIEDIDYKDDLLVWNFDEGCFASAKPVWISTPKTVDHYNLIKFSDGSELKTLLPHLGHRIFNFEKGMFTYPMTDDSPIGTHTFSLKGDNVFLAEKQMVFEEMQFYNVITNYHINIFSNNILTSAKLNNLYPISGMRFVKKSISLRNRDEFSGFSNKIIDGFRLLEQPLSFSDIIENVSNKLKVMK